MWDSRLPGPRAVSGCPIPLANLGRRPYGGPGDRTPSESVLMPCENGHSRPEGGHLRAEGGHEVEVTTSRRTRLLSNAGQGLQDGGQRDRTRMGPRVLHDDTEFVAAAWTYLPAATRIRLMAEIVSTLAESSIPQ